MSVRRAEIGGVCPRCGAPIKRIYKKPGPNGKPYYYAYHGRGRQCYLGPSLYTYVTATHEDLHLVLKGGVEPDRIVSYIEALAESIDFSRMSEEDARRIVKVLARVLNRWRREKARRSRA